MVVDRPQARPPGADHVREVVVHQARACRAGGSPLYAGLLGAVVDDLDRAGPCARVLRTDRHPDPLASVLALRFLAPLHELVLAGRAPELAPWYPSVGGTAEPVGPGLGEALHAVVEDHADHLVDRLPRPVQTNEVGRAALLVGGLALLAARWSLPLRLLEIGASAGLNLRFDRYRYDTGTSSFGPASSPVRFERCWRPSSPDLGGPIEVASRRGCDLDPLDPASAADRRLLRSYVWADQLDRLARLDAALDLAVDLPVEVDRADGPTWIGDHLRRPRPGATTVVLHAIVVQYLTPAGRRQLRAAVESAAERSSPDAPLAWLRMEPGQAGAELQLSSWPDGDERVLARSSYHGPPVEWSG
ncbi:MAG: DUF2332 domain-containing protein [Acidimicrobiia bacterium]